jgi:hypothetical protein
MNASPSWDELHEAASQAAMIARQLDPMSFGVLQRQYLRIELTYLCVCETGGAIDKGRWLEQLIALGAPTEALALIDIGPESVQRLAAKLLEIAASE